jgi:hypothetical protein
MSNNSNGPVPGASHYASNSSKSKQPDAADTPQVVGPVISGGAIERKEPIRKKFLQAYAGDSAKSVGEYLVMDVIVPGTKNIISDMVTQGINRLLFGSSRPSGGVRSNIGGSGYGKFFNGGGGNQQSTPAQMTQQARANHSFGEIILLTRADAELVIDSLRELIEQYGNAKVTNLYSLVGISSDFTDQKYGWTNLARAGVIQIREGYLLDLPRPEVLP